MSHILPHLLNGLSLGLLFALIALGFMLIVSVMEVINLSHGSLFALGAYFALAVIDPDFAWLGAFGEAYGERRALEIGVALAAQPRLLFLDEPTSGLGTEATARLADLVQDLKRDHSIVVIEHDMQFLFGLADTISVIHWGQVVAAGTPDALRENKWVQRSILGAQS